MYSRTDLLNSLSVLDRKKKKPESVTSDPPKMTRHELRSMDLL
jgi:hypothetical protein